MEEGLDANDKDEDDFTAADIPQHYKFVQNAKQSISAMNKELEG